MILGTETRRAFALAAGLALAAPAWAAAPATLDDPGTAGPGVASVGGDHEMNTELTVRNWVLCASQAFAERLAHAREQGASQAREAYDALRAARSCGRFPELHVILRSSVYRSAPEAGYRAEVFGALVNISGSWASGYVVQGGLPEQ